MNPTPPATPTVTARRDEAAEAVFLEIMQNPAVDDPYTGYRTLRESAPALITGDGTLVLTGHTECDAALRHRSLGRNDDMDGFRIASVPQEQVAEVMSTLKRSMAFVDPPRHARLRRPVNSVFTHRQVEALRPAVTAHVDRLLAGLDGPSDGDFGSPDGDFGSPDGDFGSPDGDFGSPDGDFGSPGGDFGSPGGDFMAAAAKPLPEIVISDLLGIPEADRASVLPHSQALAVPMEPVTYAEVFRTAANAQRALCAYFAELLARRRAEPTDDLLSRLGTAPEGSGLSDDEIVSTALLLLGAGVKTTTHLLGNGLRALLDHPDQVARLREDPGLIPSAVKELLRYDTPAQLDARVALEPTRFAGVELKAGQTVMTVIGAANRDPARFADAESLDVGRVENAHLSYAAGVHFCLGAQLANLEAEVLLDRLIAGTRAFAPAGAPRRRIGLGLRGFETLPVELTR
ncbi:cytochrome P450 [Streptomyces sp. NPDC041068]|uniref:cytochrome P450 n=1 Tax=Streptomyces sp. NPDC041068 TaxID=3155130 RepID=UPI0033F10144